MLEESDDLKKIVSSTISSIVEGLEGKDCQLFGHIEFDLAVVRKGDMEAGFKLILASATGKYKKESISRIKFNVLGKGVRSMRDYSWFPKFETKPESRSLNSLKIIHG